MGADVAKVFPAEGASDASLLFDRGLVWGKAAAAALGVWGPIPFSLCVEPVFSLSRKG